MKADPNYPLFDIFVPEAVAARDKGLLKVSKNAGQWMEDAMRQIAALREWKGTGEDLRLLITPVVGHPHHHNAWGALIRSAFLRKHLFQTGEYVKMKTKASHARKTEVLISKS